MEKHICPWWLAYTFDNPLRQIIHKPEELLTPFLHNGMTALDIGCGMGYFSIGMAKIVGDKGEVISVDVQQKMLDILTKRARAAGVSHRISTFLCDENNIGIDEKVDFALAFWMAHETPDQFIFLKQIRTILKNSGTLLLAEPKLHVTRHEFLQTLSMAQELGYTVTATPKIFFSHCAVLEKH